MKSLYWIVFFIFFLLLPSSLVIIFINPGWGLMLILMEVVLGSWLRKTSNESKEAATNKKADYYGKYNAPYNGKEMNCLSSNGYNLSLDNKPVYVWRNQDKLCFIHQWFDKEQLEIVSCPEVVDFGIVEIPIDDIVLFTRYGDMYTTTTVSGGGSSLGGAIIGGMIAGDAGAIIGSRREVTVSTLKVDERQTVLCVKKDNYEEYLFFNQQGYDGFLSLIPSKEMTMVNSQNSKINSETNPATQNDDIYEKIKKLARLKEEGVITEEEFSESKRELLSKL